MRRRTIEKWREEGKQMNIRVCVYEEKKIMYVTLLKIYDIRLAFDAYIKLYFKFILLYD